MVYQLSQSYSPCPWLLKEYIYCPMIPWIITHYNVVEPVTVSMEDGQVDIDYKRSVVEEALGSTNHVDYEKRFTLENGSTITVDALASSRRERVVVEIKRYRRKHYRHQVTQLKGYAYLLTKHGIPVHKLVLIQDRKVVYSKRFEEIDLETVADLLKDLERVINSDKPPKAYRSRKCISCWYRRYCPLWS